ncbi:MAG TPA: 1,4-alpha-glucan branching protein domain-containing protein [Candidatus Methylomirabilis sp.]|nr:1,4-alpha-glucan branching protein domain-containing protein [Candidatus Methylomirabilis sp.]
MERGYLALVLHAHLPFVRHAEYEDCLEEQWFYEAVVESYIPLIQAFEGWARDAIPFRLTLSLSPTLISMLLDPLLQSRALCHIQRLMDLSEQESERTQNQPEFRRLAEMYRESFGAARDVFLRYDRNLVEAFRRFQAIGGLECITCPATHGLLPVLSVNKTAVRAQIRVGLEEYRRNFGCDSPGIWIPECGYAAGLDELLKESEVRYFFVEAHGLLNAEPRPRLGVHAPVYTPSGVAAFGRDPESSKAVWSSVEGYPGDFNYREFYRDIGYDLDYETIRPYLPGGGIRSNTGIKYYRITGGTDHKEPYVRSWAMEKAALHAGDFMANRQRQIEHLANHMDRRPIVVAPYDAELFGHWWFEGPQWIDFLVRKVAVDQKTFRLVTPSEYLDMYPVNQVCAPSPSTWGYKGHNEVWVNGNNDWIYPHLHAAADQMEELARTFPQARGLQGQALNQAARELLLLQASDWAFMMQTGATADYARRRTRSHLGRFLRLAQQIQAGAIQAGWLAQLEEEDRLFPALDYRVYIPSPEEQSEETDRRQPSSQGRA